MGSVLPDPRLPRGDRSVTVPFSGIRCYSAHLRSRTEVGNNTENGGRKVRSPVRTQDFDYALPKELIAHEPPAERAGGRLMVVNRHTNRIEHRRVWDLPRVLPTRALLVVNDSKVIPARLRAERPSGGAVEVLLVEQLEDLRWTAMVRASKRPKSGEQLRLVDRRGAASEATLRFVEDAGQGRAIVELGDASQLADFGEPPLPPYIDRAVRHQDWNRYQTIYADPEGSIAAPTAGLHFTHELLAALQAQGIARTPITLHVGPGTFTPVRCERVADHTLEAERYVVSQDSARAIAAARSEGRAVVAVGTTATRVLESTDGCAGEGRADLFIYPGYSFRIVDALITNFHLPRSTLLMLVAAFAGRDLILNAYREAVRERYRFYSYGDAMLVL